jgi:hypothetical protein
MRPVAGAAGGRAGCAPDSSGGGSPADGSAGYSGGDGSTAASGGSPAASGSSYGGRAGGTIGGTGGIVPPPPGCEQVIESPDRALDDALGQWESEALEPRTKRRSTGMMVTGIVLTAVGGSAAVYGLHMIAMADPICTTTAYGERECIGNEWKTTGTVFAILGGVSMAVGIPLLIHGAGRVPANTVHAEEEASPALVVGANSVAVRLSW